MTRGTSTITRRTVAESAAETAARLTASAHAVSAAGGVAESGGAAVPDAAVEAWLADRRRRNAFQIDRVPLRAMQGWSVDPETGDLAHDTGRFFTVEGLRMRVPTAPGGGWDQPILVQREIGVLGIVTAEIGGVPHFLMQAKAEPGNTGGIRVSPTVNATRSNFTGVHRGRTIPHIEAFVQPPRDRVLVDRLQSERAAWFLRKRNRHMVVEADPVWAGDAAPDGDFCWLTFGQLRRMLRLDNVLSMEACSVLACLAVAPDARESQGALAEHSAFRSALIRSLSATAGIDEARHTLPELIGRLCALKAATEAGQRSIPLRDAAPWRVGEDAVDRPDGRYFRIIGARVQADCREVARWDQPLLEPMAGGVAALVAREFDGVLHLLLHMRVEAGAVDVAEFGPTVLCTPANIGDGPRPRYLDYVLSAPCEAVRYDTVISEEGARFFHAESRYLIIDGGEAFGEEPPEDFVWVTAAQAGELLSYGYYVNMQARTLLAALHALW
jgi:oxidase EvaA